MNDRNRGGVDLCSNTLTEKKLRLGGEIWVSTTDGSCSYQCKFCDCIYLSAALFERHNPIEHNVKH